MYTTHAQANFLVLNDHLRAVSRLEDGDLLIVDLGENDRENSSGHFGPYVLTVDALLQDVNYHFKNSHGIPCPFKHI